MSEQQRHPAMGLWHAVSIGVGGMIGAGIFSILGIAGKVAGSAAWISFLLAGGVAMLMAYSFSRLAVTWPSAGGPVEFLLKGLGDTVLAGALNLMLWIGYIFGLALYAKAFGGYASTLLGFEGVTAALNVLAVVIVLLFTTVNFIGAKAVGKSEFTIVAIKLLILLAFAGAGLAFADPARFSVATMPGVPRILYGAGIVFLAFEGFSLITNAAEDMADVKRTLPRALFLSIGITLVVYVLVVLATLGNLAVPKIVEAKEYALAAAAEPFLGRIGFTFIAVAALFSTSSAINATLYGGANVSYQIARDGWLPDAFDRRIWHRAGEGLFITSALVIVAVLLLPLEEIAMLGSAIFLIIYTAVTAGHLRLYRSTGAKPAVLITAIVFGVATFAVLMVYEWEHNRLVLYILAALALFSAGLEALYRRITRRDMRGRHEGPGEERPGRTHGDSGDRG